MVANGFKCVLQTLAAWKALRTTTRSNVLEDLEQGNTQPISEGTDGIPLDIETDTARGEKHLFSGQQQASLRSSGKSLGECQ